MTKMHPAEPDLPEQLAAAIRQVWPDGVIDMPVDMDHAPLWDVYPKLKARLSRIPGTAAAIYECEPQGGPSWGESLDRLEDTPDWDEESRSYYLFFLTLVDKRFQFETDILEPDENGVEQRFQGEGRIGCVVGISLVAPFAVVRLDEMEVFENGSRSEPDIEPHLFDLDGNKLDAEAHFREMIDNEGMSALRKLRNRVVAILNDYNLAVISEEDLDKPVPWLRAGQEVFLAGTGKPITVREVFFFHGP